MLNDTVSFGVDPGSVPADPRDRYEERLDFLAALEELDKLPERLKAVVLVRSQVERHAEVADVLGINRQRVAFLLRT
jgi:DNA-directed RNA polymerase specialized sigma24 family protein